MSVYVCVRTHVCVCVHLHTCVCVCVEPTSLFSSLLFLAGRQAVRQTDAKTDRQIGRQAGYLVWHHLWQCIQSLMRGQTGFQTDLSQTPILAKSSCKINWSMHYINAENTILLLLLRYGISKMPLACVWMGSADLLVKLCLFIYRSGSLLHSLVKHFSASWEKVTWIYQIDLVTVTGVFKNVLVYTSTTEL